METVQSLFIGSALSITKVLFGQMESMEPNRQALVDNVIGFVSKNNKLSHIKIEEGHGNQVFKMIFLVKHSTKK